MKRRFILILSILLLFVLYFSGCTEKYNANYNILNNDATITIHNFNNKELRLYIQGSNNEVRIDQDVTVKSIIIDGMDNIVRISHNHINVTIDVYQGTNSEVVYYD